MSTISKTYKWNWVDENGHYCGWNWTNAYTKAEARREAKMTQSSARDDQWGRNKGMYLDEKSLRRISTDDFNETWKKTYQD